MSSSVRSIALHVLRAVGGFALARYVTRRHLRILCYHGFSTGDEHEVAPYMFMRSATFERRLQILKRHRIPVVTLDEAVQRLQRREIRSAETVITFDDGWASTLTIGAPLLEKYGFPASVYLVTEHLAAGNEAFNVAISYMIRRSERDTLTLERLHPRLDGSYDIKHAPDDAAIAVIKAAEASFPLAERQRLLHPIAEALGFDLRQVLQNGRFRLLTRAQIQELFRRGFDLQLHTHTHRLPDSRFEAAAEEIEQNRNALKEAVGTVPRHFCYPSGKYSTRHAEWLRQLGIVSATTCDPGLNDTRTPLLQLNRHLDNEEASDIAFEAEVCGVREVARRIRAYASHLTRVSPRGRSAA
jgi:peptidoglycan/xylan/chitin deacetylase (PgdA/CDA1 family)